MEDHSSYLNEDFIAYMPFELQVLIFSRIKLQDLVRFASTSHYWSINAWSFAMSLGANEFSEFVIKIADKASYDPSVVTDLFSDPVPTPVEDLNLQKDFRLFHFLFQKVELSPQKVPHFEIEMTDGFVEVKDDFIDALTLYPGFLNEIRSLKISKLRLEDVQRILWYTKSLQVLEIHSEKVGTIFPESNSWFYSNNRSTLVRNTVPLALYHGIDFSNCPNLKAITFKGFAVGEWDPIMILQTAKNLKALSFIAGEFIYGMGNNTKNAYLGTNMAYLAIRDSDVKVRFSNINHNSAFFDLCSRVKVIDIRACKYNCYKDVESARDELHHLFPQADVLADENEYYEFDLND